MFGIKHLAGKALVLASVMALTGGVAMAERGGDGPRDGEQARKHHRDGDGPRHRGDRGERGERGDRGPRRDRGDMARRLFGGMELDEDQKTQIKDIMKAHGEERKAWHEAHQDEFQALREKMRAAHQSQDKDAAQAVRDEIKALMESAPKPDASHDQVRAVLNDEQQATFDERIEKMRERMENWKEGRGDGPPHGRRGDGPPHGEHGMMGPDGDGPPRDGRRARGARMFGNLDLDDDQKAKLRETMQSDQTREEKMAAVREMLNEDQRAQLDENIAKMKRYREEHKGKRGDRDGDRPRRERKEKEGGDSEQLDL